MSKSIKHVKTHGFLEDASRIRRKRKHVRSMKEQLINDIQELFVPSPVAAQDY